MWSTNADVLNREKVLELKFRIENEVTPPDIITICEVKPKHHKRSIEEIEYSIPGYKMETKNLSNGSTGRGIITFIKSYIEYRVISLESEFEEYLCTECRIPGGENILVTSIYRSPNSEDSNNNALNRFVSYISTSRADTRLLIVGDFNFPKICWDDVSTPSEWNSKEARFIEGIRDGFLMQHVTSPTRGRGDDCHSLLDLVFSNGDFIELVEHQAALGKSDHAIIETRISSSSSEPTMRSFRNYDKGDFTALATSMNRNWREEFAGKDVHQQWEIFKEAYDDAVERHIPKIKIGNRKIVKTPIERNTRKKLRNLINKKNKEWNKYLKSRDPSVRTKFRRLRNQVRSLTRKAEKIYEKNIVAAVKTNPKKFWKYTRKKTKSSTNAPDLLLEDGENCTKSDQEKSNRFAEYFSSVFCKDQVQAVDTQPTSTFTDGRIESCSVTADLVCAKLKSLNVSKSPGPDQIHPRVLKETASVLSIPLSIIIETSFSTASLPLDWKSAHIAAIYKKGPKNQAGNYRPVSLTSIIAKVAESFVREIIIGHMKHFGLFSNKQFGFLGGRSTVLQLLIVLDKWTEIIDKGGSVDILYFDFMKAFDKVSHSQMLSTITRYGISGSLHKWITNFLLTRRQRVCVNGSLSDWHTVDSGIPQGTVLGPLLFILFINDLPTSVNTSEVYLFADDLKIFNGIYSEEDIALLQRDVSAVSNWVDRTSLKFHPDKCKHLRIGLRAAPEADYVLGNTGIHPTKVDTEKDIGVTFDTKLTFEKHISEKINKANSILGLITHTFEYKDESTIITLYKALVRPHLEFANQVWAPYLKKHVNSIENVQRRMTRLLPGMKDLSYPERLRKVKLPTLGYRRLRGDMIELYKIVKGIYDPDITEGLLSFAESSTRGHQYKLIKFRPRLDLRKNSFFFRVVDHWNNLPQSVVEAPSLISFESRLDRFWSNKEILYDYTAATSAHATSAQHYAHQELALEA